MSNRLTLCNEGSINFVEITDTKKLKREDAQTRNIIIVGLTGSGKSSIIRNMFGRVEAGIKSEMTLYPCTDHLQQYRNQIITHPDDPNEKYVVNYFDTVGLGSQDVDVETILNDIIQHIPSDLAQIHKIVFCFKVDRLRTQMSQVLNLVYCFFKSIGAKPENFAICLTFCDILSNKTVGKFWEEVKSCRDLDMAQEITTVTYTSFPNMDECDESNEALTLYLMNKARSSEFRVFQTIIQAKCEPFEPYKAILEMSQMDFEKICELLTTYQPKGKWLWQRNVSISEQLLKQLRNLRPMVIQTPAQLETNNFAKNKFCSLLSKNSFS